MATNKTPRNIEIRIELLKAGADSNGGRAAKGEFQYSRALARVMTGDTVSWWSNDGPFALSFQHGTPFKQLVISSGPSRRGKGIFETETLTVEERPAPARYYYTVALTSVDPKDPEKSETFIDSCPALLDEC